MHLEERDFSYWSLMFNDWHLEKGAYGIQVGTSSRDLVQSIDVTIEGDDKTIRLNSNSTKAEWETDPVGSAILSKQIEVLAGQGINLPDNPNTLQLFNLMPLVSVLTFPGSAARSLPKRCWRSTAAISANSHHEIALQSEAFLPLGS